MSVRLSLAVETGGFPVPETGRIAVFHPASDVDLSALPKERVLIVQPFAPDHVALAARGYDCVPELPADVRFAASVVFLSRAKALTRGLLAQAAELSDGPVLVDGGKTDGVDSVLKALRARCDVSAPISKAHGKAFWFDATGTDLSDWQVATTQIDGGFQTAPGVFSADGVDPASALLVAALPAKLGRNVVDLGAGWGYLSSAVLQRETVQALHLVEADHSALSCARQNINDPRAQFHWADARSWQTTERVDCVISNPPFHTSRAAEPSLGQAFITAASGMLAPAGAFWLVANRHLPYEATLAEQFATVSEVAGDNRFKVLQASRPRRHRR
ncbi:class I SAM-dependent methyltransferase [Phaeobacter inhibens]|uniref:class I SAM-dependent methyltransferase n=1 Tax=Phaeobacter inhibens TaxID=221822 RepID=UPI0021A7C1B8|nr:class I SAM-dependent methyltransferase [Phaeobacter inhibens]UWR87966.1 class I SAM-dependent methyltransferase [Phaeobacter inhibens]